MIYVAAPYTHSDPNIVKQRVLDFASVMAELIRQGEHPVSPLMNHFLTDYVPTDFPLTWDYWKEYSLSLLQTCSAIYVITMDGWEQSTGVAAEIEMAVQMNKPVTYITLKELRNAD
jgi:hypothetical protein